MEKKTYYPNIEGNPDFAKLEEKVLEFWQQENVFKASVESRPAKQSDGSNNEFIFYDGPPFANGLPHYGHLLTGYVKDIVARYQTQKGKKVERRFGWDCHGLPAEMGAEKELAISGRMQIMDFGIDKFNNQCRTSVMKFTSEWEEYVNRQGRWVDFQNGYKTMDVNYMESVMWAFKELYNKGLLYESMRVMPYSWACETPLSNFETRLDNSYRERADKAVTVAFELDKEGFEERFPNIRAEKYKILAWTTTPWTLPSNLALGIAENIRYAYVVKEGICYIAGATALLTSYGDLSAKKKEIIDNIEVTSGSHDGDIGLGKGLIGLSYKPLFPYFKDQPNAFHILSGDFVQEGDGTGIVHLAPGFGEDDQRVCADNGIDLVCQVDNAGRFTDEVFDIEGLSLKGKHVIWDEPSNHKETGNEYVIRYLKEHKLIVGNPEQILHNYPHCWRTDTPLIYKAVPSWYVEVTKFKDRMVELNQQINWVPGHIKDGLFGKWLENARDWSISRNRFWGAPIPVWKSDNPENKELYVFGSIKELEEFFGKDVKDLHRPYVDDLTKPDPLDPKYTIKRVEDVFDCWFESGSMPYGQAHYPFENKEWFEDHFPADFIVEYTAQTRGWFYTLMVLSTALFDRPPFLNCICHGVVLDEKGQKLSKRLNNYADPKVLFAKYGADALRWLMVSSPVLRGGELLIDKEGNMVRDALRLAIKPIWNAYNFFTLYANADGVKAEYRTDSADLMDRYILAKAKEAVHKITDAMDHYDTPSATTAVEAFFEVLNNWYIRRNRDRFWRSFSVDVNGEYLQADTMKRVLKNDIDANKQAAYDTLYTVLHVMCRATAPLLPFMSESIWSGLTNQGLFSADASVHVSDFPHSSDLPDAGALTSDMDRVRDVCNAALAIRNAQNLRVRQPLAKLSILGSDVMRIDSYADLIKDEVNVKHIEVSEEIGNMATFKLQVNFPIVGKRLPAKMKDIIAASKQGKWGDAGEGNIEVAGEILLSGEYSVLLEARDPKATNPLSTNDALVVLDLNVTEELKSEGIARDIVRMVQQSRKEADLNVSDRIVLNIETVSSDITNALTNFKNYIAEQTLAISITSGTAKSSNHAFEQELEGEKVVIGIDVAA